MADRRRRRLRPHPQRDLDRRGDAAAPPGRRRSPTTPSSWSTPPRPPAACASTRPRSTSTTSPRRSASASDGGLWLAAVSPAADRAHRAHRRVGPLDPGVARPRASRSTTRRKDQTYNTPGAGHDLPRRRSRSSGSTATAGSSGPRPAATGRPRSSTRGPRRATYATPFVAEPAERSHVVATIDLDERIDANVVSKVLRANGIVDTESYRKLGRNQLRIAMFPAIEPDDVAALTRCIDHVVAALRLTPRGDRSRRSARRVHASGVAATDRGMAMPTTAEVRATLTGPGGPFEVVTDVVDGVEMKVYKDRLPHLRSVAELAAARGRRPAVPRLRRRAGSASAEFFRLGQHGVGRAARPVRLRPRRPGGRAVGQQPRVVRELLGHRQPRRRSSSGSTAGGRPTRSSTACRTPAPRSWSPTGAGSSASPTTSTSCPTSRPSSSSTPTPPTSAAIPGCTASTS